MKTWNTFKSFNCMVRICERINYPGDSKGQRTGWKSTSLPLLSCLSYFSACDKSGYNTVAATPCELRRGPHSSRVTERQGPAVGDLSAPRAHGCPPERAAGFLSAEAKASGELAFVLVNCQSVVSVPARTRESGSSQDSEVVHSCMCTYCNTSKSAIFHDFTITA